MNSIKIKRLLSGGIITNYFCTSKCRHCLYRSGPKRGKDYITAKQAEKVMGIVRKMGCGSVHIGGGEPMLRPEELARVLDASNRTGIVVEYVETNSSWFQDMVSAKEILNNLKDAGLKTLLVSISPFHNEYIPFFKVKGVLEACKSTGVHVFPWISDFLTDLSLLDDQKTHTLDMFKEKFGEKYLKRALQNYWVHLGGRSLNLVREFYPHKSPDKIMKENPGNCHTELSNTSHFHFDLYGNYIPGLCVGLSISVHDLDSPLFPEKYPIITMLANSGIRGLFQEAHDKYGYIPQRVDYVNKCDLCTEIRTFLKGLTVENFTELGPEGFYFS